MTRAISTALKSHLVGPVTTVAYCWKVTRRDGQIFGFTDHDEDLTLDGVAYQSKAGFMASTVQTSAGLAVDNLELLGVLSSAYVTDDDLLAGKWDYAEIQIFECNWADLSQGVVMLRRGWLGQVRTENGQFTAELRGMMQVLQQSVGQIYGPNCRADLGDTRCKVDLAPLTFPASVNGVATRRSFAASGLSQADGYFDYGLVTWTSGQNTGLSMEIKTWTQSGGIIELQLPMPYDLALGDTFDIVVGCDRTVATCQAKFNNVVNYRGEPHLPGLDQILQPGALGT